MKKNLLYGLGLGLALFGLTQTTQAAVGDNFQDGGIWYTVLDETAKTVQTKVASDGGYAYDANDGVTGDVIIPSTVPYNNETYTVVAIGDYSFFFGELSSITLPETLTSIGIASFSGCSGLTELTIPASVTSLGARAFSDCTELATITVNANLASLPEAAFLNIDIQEFHINCTTPPSLVTSGTYTTFSNPNTSYYMGDAVLYVPENLVDAYKGSDWNTYFTSIEGVEVEDESGAPAGTNFEFDGIKYTILDADAKTVETMASTQSNNYDVANGQLEGDIYIPEKVTYNGVEYTVVAIGEGSFYMSDITSIVLPSTIESIGDSAFYRTDITTVTIPSSVTTIEDSAFAQCEKLEEVIFLAEIDEIPVALFQGCTSLMEFYITTTTPPAISNANAFYNIPEGAILYVEDADAVAAYQASDWANYFTIKSLYEDEVSTVAVTINVDGIEAGTDMSTYFTATFEEFVPSRTGEIEFDSASYTGDFTPSLVFVFEPTKDYILEVAFAESLTTDEGAISTPEEGNTTWEVSLFGDAPKAVTINVTVKPYTVGVNGLNSENGAAAIYNLQGVKVAEKDAHNGIFIINGKKVVLK